MITKKNKLLIVGIVLSLTAYYIYNQNRKRREVEILKEGAESPSPSPDLKKENPVETECREEWARKIGKVTRFISAEARQKSESDYVSNCLKNK